MSNVEYPFSDHSVTALIRLRWPALTADDAATAAGGRDLLIVRIVERYGISPEWAERQVAEWEDEQRAAWRTGG